VRVCACAVCELLPASRWSLRWCMRRPCDAKRRSRACTVVTVHCRNCARVWACAYHTWCDVVVTRGSGSDVDRRRGRVVSCARGPVNGPCHSGVGPVVRLRGTARSMKLDEIDAEHDVMCVPCGGGAGRGPWGGAFSAQSLQRSTPGDDAASQNPRPALSQPATAASAGAVPHRDARAGAGPRAPDGVAVRAGPRPARV
jgi:hypothetical protein